ncbi:hypothetical protein [Alteromonas sp. S015]|uniref:hypothetical protein n=1 Tax=Alteromonas sp. S015 TaxID=3117401 RepID=UPI002FE1C237
MAPGAPAFAVTYQSAQNVLAFYDPMASLESSIADVSFSVFGFFNPTGWDPLLGVSNENKQGFTEQQQWQQNISNLNMQVGDGSAQSLIDAQAAWQQWAKQNGVEPTSLPEAQQDLPGQLLPFGAVQKLSWQGIDFFYENDNIPHSGQIPVAIGNTPSEALGTWLNEQIPDSHVSGYSIERLIQAVMTDSISTFLTNVVTFEFTNAGLTFGGSSGGSVTVVSLPDDNNSNQTIIPLDHQQTAALTDLNAAEVKLNRLTDALRSRQWSLFAAQWKLTRKPGNTTVQSAITSLTAQIAALSSDFANTTQSVSDLRSELNALLGSEYVASLQPTDQFQLTNDPVILCASVRTDDKIVNRSLDKKELECRMSGQYLTGFEMAVDGSRPASVAAEDLADKLDLSFLENTNIPLEAKFILLESLMLDPGLQPWLASLWLKAEGGGPAIADVEAAIKNIQSAVKAAPALDDALSAQLMADVSGFDGVAPDPMANQDWEQPWTPVYIAWEGEWHPTSTTPAEGLNDWELGEIDFEWQSTTVSSTSYNYNGRTLVNSDAPSILASRIDVLLQIPDLKIADFVRNDLEKVSRLLLTSDIVVQSLSGFSDALIQRSVSEAEGNQQEGATPDNAVVPAPPVSGVPPFLPIRSGHLALSKLWVLDSWGQTFKAEANNGYIVPIRSESMVTPGGDTNRIYAQLPPRLTQPARIEFNLIDATSEPPTPSNSSDDTTPVCGFIAADFLSGGLLVFDSEGFAQGVILPIIKDVGTGVRWEAAPGINVPLGSRPNLKNRHLQAMIDGILEQTERGVDALGELLDLMDGVSHFATQGDYTKSNLSILIGEPLAVVRASVTLELSGDPLCDQAYDNTDKQVTNGYTEVSFPVRVGDMGLPESGVTGFYFNDDYANINAVYGYNPNIATLRRAASRGPDAFNEVATQNSEDFTLEDELQYVKLNKLVPVTATESTQYLGTNTPPPERSPGMLTVLMEPFAQLPIIMGYLPIQIRQLQPGVINTALANLQYITRAGPMLVNPNNVSMPLPADIKGTWDYVWRDSVTTWTDSKVANKDSKASLAPMPLQLYWGWMRLSGAFSLTPENTAIPEFAPTPERLMNTSTVQVPDLKYTLSPTSVLINQTTSIQIEIENISGGDIAVGFDFSISINLPVGACVSDLIEEGQQTGVSASAIDRNWTTQVLPTDSKVTIIVQALRPFSWGNGDNFILLIDQIAVNGVQGSDSVTVTAQASEGSEKGTSTPLLLSKIAAGLTISAYANPEKVGATEYTEIFWTATEGAKVELISNQPTQSEVLKGDGPVFSGKFKVKPNQDAKQTFYSVEVQNAGNTKRESTVVIVNLLPPAVNSFSAESTDNLQFNQPVSLFWDNSYATSSSILPGEPSVPLKANKPDGFEYTPSNHMNANDVSLTLTLFATAPLQPTAKSDPLVLNFALAEIVYFCYKSMDPSEGVTVPETKNANPFQLVNSDGVWTLTVTGPGGPLTRTIGGDQPEVRYFGPAYKTLSDPQQVSLNYWVNEFKAGDELILQPTGQQLTPDNTGKGSVDVNVSETTEYTLEATLSGIKINNTITVTLHS